MSTSITTIKSKARTALKDKWVVAIIAPLIVLFSFFIIQNAMWLLSMVLDDIAALILILANIVILGPLSLGVIRFFWRLYGGLDEAVGTVFYYFSAFARYRKALRLFLKLTVKYILLTIIFNLPAFCVSVISNVRLYDMFKMPIPMWSQNLTSLSDFLYTLGAVLTLFALIRFYLAPILLIANEELEVDEAIHMSSVISKNTFSDLFYLILSMLHWILLSLLFIPLVFTLPYFIMCYISHSLEAIKAYNEKIQKLNGESFPSFVAGA